MKLEIHVHNHFPDKTEILSALHQIQGDIQIIMGRQEDFDAKITEANAKLDTLGEGLTSVQSAITAEAQQISDWIAANPSVDTSGLDGVVSRLTGAADSVGGLSDSVGGIFTPPAAEPTE